MDNFWLTVKVWTKTTIIAIVVVYGLLFIYNNSGENVRFWWWFGHNEEHTKLAFGLASFLFGVIMTILVKTTFTTLRQVQTLQNRSRTQRIERDIAEMKGKASRLQTRPTTANPAAIPGAFETPDPPTPTV